MPFYAKYRAVATNCLPTTATTPTGSAAAPAPRALSVGRGYALLREVSGSGDELSPHHRDYPNRIGGSPSAVQLRAVSAWWRAVGCAYSRHHSSCRTVRRSVSVAVNGRPPP